MQIVAGFNEHNKLLTNLGEEENSYIKEQCLEEINDCEMTSFEKLKYIYFSPYWLQTFVNQFFGEIVATNISILLSFALTGIAGYYLSQIFLKKYAHSIQSYKFFNVNVISFITSLFPVLATPRIHHLLVGHKNGFLMPFLILIFILIENTKSLKSKIVLTFVLVFLAFNESFFLYYGLIYIFARVLFIEIFEHKILHKILVILKSKEKSKLIDEILSFSKKYLWLVFAVGLSLFVKQIGVISIAESSTISAGRPYELIALASPLFSYLYQNIALDHEHSIFIGTGIIIIALAFVPIIRSIRKSIEAKRIKFTEFDLQILFFLILCLFFILISLGSKTPLYKVLYDYLPKFNFSRTPERAIFVTLPLLTILSTFVFTKLKKSLSTKQFSLLIISFCIITIVTFHTFKPISLISLPNFRNDFDEVKLIVEPTSKILFVPTLDTGHFFGSLYEYFLSHTDYLSVNGYHPLPSIDAKNFENNYMSKINAGEISEVEFRKMVDDYEIDYVIVLKEFVNNDEIGYPFQTIPVNYDLLISKLKMYNNSKSFETENLIVIKIL